MHKTCDEDTTIVEYIPDEDHGDDAEPSADPLAEARERLDTRNADSRLTEHEPLLRAPLVL